MLYVFHVDVGRMMTFDMTLALSSVENLKDTIERLHHIPATNIVLLVSGGEMLTQPTQVAYYSAGTDTNPIYMFLTGDTKLQPCVPQLEVPETDLREQVDRCLELPSVYDTVVKRAQLALRIFEMARDEERLCERLVHEQHLQQQGWSAVIANIEDLTEEFRQRFRNFCSGFEQDLRKRSKYMELLQNFSDDLTQLSRIPILPGLMTLAEEDFHGFDEYLDTDEVFSRSQVQQESVLMVGAINANTNNGEQSAQAGSDAADSESVDDKAPNKKPKMVNESAEECTAIATITTMSSGSQQSSTLSNRRHHLNLLQWITSKENHNTLQKMCEECVQGLSTFTEETYEKLKMEWQNIVKLAEQSDVKEIKGLSERLRKLDEFMHKIKNMVQDQRELSTAFQQNQNRAMNLRDPSILPDLCASHQSQLVVMLQNQQKIREHRRCIARAKDELGANLHTRLKRIVWIENAMSEFDNMMLFYRRCLRRAERHIHIIEQIHQAPSIYVAAVTEVVRRKIFSGEFRQWASKLAEDFDTIHSEEIRRRELFNASFEGHFLNNLFPGMNDMPPAFANENPLVFDTRLPNLTRSDIDMLSSFLPELSPQIQLPDMGPVIHFFVSRSGMHQKERLEELLRQQVAAIEKPLPQQRISELQKTSAVGCEESETDTETEFEKVLTATQTVATSTSEQQLCTVVDTVARSTTTESPLMHSATTLTEETEQSTRAEVQRLRAQLDAMSKLSLDCIRMARANIAAIRADTSTYREDLHSELQTLHEQWRVVRQQNEKSELRLQRASSVHQQELQSFRNALEQQTQEMEDLQRRVEQTDNLQIKCVTLEAQLEELRDQLKAAQQEKESALAEAREELIHEHKTEIESLRCRFKLMTSMERSPSDTSLERIERPTSTGEPIPANMIEMGHHEAILAHLRATLEAERESAITAALEVERSIWQAKMLHLSPETVLANVNILKDILEDRERQLDLMRQKDTMLTKENIQLKTRLDALTNDDGSSWLKEKIEYLNRDKCRLEEELNMEKTRRLEMETSLRSSTYEQIALSRSKSSGSSHKYVVLESCGKGDIVFVVWSVRHVQFMVVQDSQSLYFVHGDSLAGLNLRLPIPVEGAAAADELPIPMPYYAIGRVTEKEYCQAKKDENRYRVTKGSKFYRIKLAPLTSKQTRRERLESFSTSISRSVSQCESHSELSAAAPSGGITATTAVGSISALRQIQSKNCASDAIATDTRDLVDFAPLEIAGAGASGSIVISGGSSSGVALVATGSSGGIEGFKERTISISSVAEEDDEPVSLLVERYISVSEEEEPLTIVTTTISTPATTTKTLQQSVITEQPTASNKLKLELMLASADIQIKSCDATIATETATINATTTQLPAENADMSKTLTTPTELTTTASSQPSTQTQVIATTPTYSSNTSTTKAALPLIPTMLLSETATIIATESIDPCSPSVPISVGTTSEDSDEYRSLEAKDDTDFPISE